jgi:hypothetical protein
VRPHLGSAAPIAILATLISAAPAAGAPPECADVTPTTRLCRTSGHTGITTSPDPALTNRYPGWGYAGMGVGLSAGGWWFPS